MRAFLLVACLVLLGAQPALPARANVPPAAGLVLWLDAGDAATLSVDDAGHVSRWADKSPQGNHAVQTDLARQPQLAARALGGRPVVRFDGSSFLNLGQPAGLDFRPGDPFTIVAVYHVAAGNYGTFLAKGGGTAAQRAYQLYVAPGRQGAVTYGVMREAKRVGGAKIAVEVCDGVRAEVFANGRPALAFDAARGSSKVDVLVGARRQTADNQGVFYPLTGDLAEVLVYNRALDRKELGGITKSLSKKYRLGDVASPPADVREAIAAMKGPADFARLVDLAGDLARLGDGAALPLRSLLESHPEAAPDVAEVLMLVAERNQLGDALASLAAELLGSEDPFARGLAEWAIAMKVGGENNPQQARWPGENPPAWYATYAGLPAAARLEGDWVRQAVSLEIHRDPARMLASVGAMIDRGRRMGEDFRRSGAKPQTVELVQQRLPASQRIHDQLASPTPDLSTARCLWLDARRAIRDVVLANPAIDFRRLLFVEQFAPHTVRNITRSYAWKHKPGGDVCILDDLNGGPVRGVLGGRLGPGYVWGLDLGWDADRVVFGFARQTHWPPAVDTANYAVEGTNVFRLRQEQEPLHVYECRLDGSAPVQLTDAPYWSDFEPTYTAGGDVVFASDRCSRSAECGNDTYDHNNPNLYILSRRDGRVRRLTDSKDIDRYPHSLGDGRIAYTHWEYQERHFMEVHALWTLRPDGAMSDALYKHHMRAPYGLRDTRSVPGSTRLVSIAAGHHTFAYGPVVLVDPAWGTNNVAGLRIVTPGVKPQEGPMAGTPVDQGGVLDRGGLYQTPWALSETCLLASYSYARPHCTAPAGADSNGFGVYLIDCYGNRELLHRDPLYSCTFPMPLQQRPRPPAVPDVRDKETARSERAVCYVTDVYDGLAGVPRGTIKYLRIAQHVPWPYDQKRGQMDYIPGNAGTRRIDFQSWSPVRVIGTVPVEADGSAAFTVPADTALYFQALDERHMEVLRMRSMVSLAPGEVRGCRGCHESQTRATALGRSMPLAVQKPTRTPAPPAWGSDKLLGYEWLVQPVLDRRCARCHGAEKPDGGLNLTSTRAADGLMQSYRTMFGVAPGAKSASGKVLVSCSNRFDAADVTRPKQFGSHRSPLVRVLLDDELHRKEAKLSPEEWTALVTWVDANAPYYDAFLNKRPDGGGPPRREVAVIRTTDSTETTDGKGKE